MTIHDVARYVGVSSITVSRVLTGSAPTSKAVRQRVREAIETLGYVPNELAQGLRARATRTIGLMVSDISNRFFTSIARGVEDVAHAAGYCVILCNTDEDPAKEQLYLDMLGRKRVDGLVVAHTGDNAEALLAWNRTHGPVCLIDRALTGVSFTALGIDIVRTANADVAAQLVRHLIGHGHRRIAIVNGPLSIFTARRRLLGYHQALEEAAIPTDESLEWHGPYTAQSGYTAAMALLAHNDPPTAFFTTNNFLTVGVLAALRERGVRVPEERALAGFDDIDELALVEPFVTVAAQPAHAIGQQAATRLLDRIKHRHGRASEKATVPGTALATAPMEGQIVVLPTEMIIRRSCGCNAHRMDGTQPNDIQAAASGSAVAGLVAPPVGRLPVPVNAAGMSL